LKDKGNIDRILKYAEIDTIYSNIKNYNAAIFSVDPDRPNVLKLLRAKLFAERFLIAKLTVSISLNQFVLDNRVCFIVINIFCLHIIRSWLSETLGYIDIKFLFWHLSQLAHLR
jgi:hypothetical protein